MAQTGMSSSKAHGGSVQGTTPKQMRGDTPDRGSGKAPRTWDYLVPL